METILFPLLIVLLCLRVSVKVLPMRKARVHWWRINWLKVGWSAGLLLLELVFLGSIWVLRRARTAPARAAARLRRRGRAGWVDRQYIQRARKALQHYAEELGPRARAGIRARILGERTGLCGLIRATQRLQLFTFQAARPGPAARTMRPGVVDGKHHQLQEDLATTTWTWKSKYAQTRFGQDATQTFRVNTPTMVNTGKKDNKGNPIFKKVESPHQLQQAPPMGHTFTPYQPKAIIRTEKVQRPRILQYKTETRQVTMPGGKVVQEKVKVPVFEMKTEKGPDGVDRQVPVQDLVDQEVIGEVPAKIDYQYIWGHQQVIQGKTSTKETLLLDLPKHSFRWTVNRSELYLVMLTDPKDPEFGAVMIYDMESSALGAKIPAPSGHDAKGHPVDCHWELKDDVLALKVDNDLNKPWPGPPAPPAYKDLATGKTIQPKGQDPVMPAFPVTIDPSVTWDGTKIEISGNGNTLASIKTLYEEHFDNAADGTALDSYDPNWTVSKAGASYVQIDTGQYHSGNSSLELYRDGANNCTGYNWVSTKLYDYCRFTAWMRMQNVGDGIFFALENEAGSGYVRMDFTAAGNIDIRYGNGAGGTNTVTAKAYLAGTWYKITFDVDVTNDKYRCWVDDILYPGPNANAGGWDNMDFDGTMTYVKGPNFYFYSGMGSVWVDDLTAELGDEIYSYGYLPYYADEISEAQHPNGTLSDFDGDWTWSWGTAAVAISEDATTKVIGSNSIKAEFGACPTPNDQGIKYVFDTEKDLSNYEGVEFNIMFSDLSNFQNWVFMLWQDGVYYYKIYVTTAELSAGKWSHIKVPFSGFSTLCDWTRISAWGYYFETSSTAGSFHHVDGLHFYGARNGRGAAWSSQSIQTKSGTTTQLNRTVPMPAVNSPVNNKNVNLVTLLPLEADGLDRSGRGHDFTPAGTPGTEGNPIYGGTHTRTDFDGVDDEYHYTGSSHATPTGCVMCNFETNATPASAEVITTLWAGDANRIFLRDNCGTLELVDNINAAANTFYLSIITPGRAYHFAWVWDNVYWYVYLDGKKVLQVATIKGTDDLVDPFWYIGCWKDSGSTCNFFNGAIWDAAYYDSSSAPSVDQIAQMAGAGKDLYIDDSKGITYKLNGYRYEYGRRGQEETNDLCEQTTDWEAQENFSSVSSYNDSVYGTKCLRFTRSSSGQGRAVFHTGFDWTSDHQKIAGTKYGIARYGKLVMWLKTNGNNTLYLISPSSSGGNYVYTFASIALTSFWKRYDFNLSDLNSTAGIMDWSSVGRIDLTFMGGNPGETVDLNDIHFEENIITNRSTNSGAYDIGAGGIHFLRYSEQRHFVPDGWYGFTCDIKYSKFYAEAYSRVLMFYGVTVTNAEDILVSGTTVSNGIYIVWQPGSIYKRIQDDTIGGYYSFLCYNDGGFTNHILINCISNKTNVVSYPQYAAMTFYNYHNNQGNHKLYGNVPFTSSSVSDFPQSKARILNSSKGWAIQGGLGTVERTIDGTLFITNDDGADASIHGGTALTASIDIGPQDDSDHPNNFNIRHLSDGADADWDLQVYLSTAGIGTDYIEYETSFANDVNGLSTMDVSGTPASSAGATDRANINYIYIKYLNIASASELVRIWVDEIYLETDAGKVKFEPYATVTAFKFTIGASTTKILDHGTTWIWDDTADAGYDISTGTLKCLGTAGSHISIRSENTPPTAYWRTGAANLSFICDHTDFSGTYSFYSYTYTDLDNCTFQYNYSGSNTIILGGTLISMTNITIANCSYGFYSSGIFTGLNNIDITALINPVSSNNGRLEFIDSNFDETACNCYSSGIILSKDHNDVAGDFVIILADSDTVLFSEITTEPDPGDDIYFYMETGGTSATFTFDEGDKTVGSLYGQATKQITINENISGGTILTVNGPDVQLYRIKTTLSTIDFKAGIDMVFPDISGAGFHASSAGEFKFEGSTGSHITVRSAAAPPTNYWLSTCNSGRLTADYTDFEYANNGFHFSDTDMDHCTLDHSKVGNWAMDLGGTISSFTHNTISNTQYGLRVYTATAALSDITLTGISDIDIVADAVKIEFDISHFNAANCRCDSTGIIFSKDHNAVDGNFVAILDHGDTVNYSEITNRNDAYDDFYIYLEKTGTAATFGFDVPGLEFGILYKQGGKTITINWYTYTGPSAPQGLAIDYSVDDQLTLSWTAPASTGGWRRLYYDLYRGTAPGGETLYDLPAELDVSYLDSGLPPRTRYYYKLAGVNSVGEGTLASKNEMTAGPPNVPRTLAVERSFERSTILTWTAPADDGHHTITAYRVYRALATGPALVDQLAALGVVLRFQDIALGLVNRTKYYYVVRALNGFHGGTEPDCISDPSNEINATPAPNGPLGFTANHLLELVTILPRIGSEGHGGEPDYGDSYKAYARVSVKTTRTRDGHGETLMAKNTILLDGSVPIDEDDGIIMPNGEQQLILTINEGKPRTTVLQREVLT